LAGVFPLSFLLVQLDYSFLEVVVLLESGGELVGVLALADFAGDAFYLLQDVSLLSLKAIYGFENVFTVSNQYFFDFSEVLLYFNEILSFI
jgi:hypothetical protein